MLQWAKMPDVHEVCTRWNADRASLSEGSWSGSDSSCTPGDLSSTGRDNALLQVNLYRWLAGLPAVTTSSDRNAKAQACALIMHANATIDHYPGSDWDCYTEDGALAARKSNIATTGAVYAVDLYMVDPGEYNADSLGHRRWILSNGLGPLGIGSTTDYSCMWVLDGTGSDRQSWTAWPPPGVFPIEAGDLGWSDLDETGWTLQSDDIDLSGASVTVTADGSDAPVVVEALDPWYGSQWALKMTPSGWSTTAGTTYHVEVTGISTPIAYDVRVASCSR